jgi:N-acetylmuramoyl-L-alanine amidase
VRNSVWLLFFFLLAFGSGWTSQVLAHQAPSASPPSTGAPQSAPSQQPSTAQALPAQSGYTGPVIVLDPAHGGTDPGARGQNGPIEKDVVLQFARVTRVELVRQGYRVVLTRDDDSSSPCTFPRLELQAPLARISTSSGAHSRRRANHLRPTPARRIRLCPHFQLRPQV